MTKPFAALSALILLLGSAHAVAADAQTLYLPEAAPWSNLTGDANGNGVFDDWATEITKRTGLVFDIKRAPSARLQQALKDGSVDLAFGVKSTGTASFVDYPACPVASPVIIIAAKGFALTKIDDLYAAPQGVGVIRGVTYDQAFDENAQIKKSEEANVETILKKMAAGRLQATIGSGVSLYYQAKTNGLRDVLADRLVVGKIDACLRTPTGKSNTPVVQAMVKALDAMKADGTAAAIVTKYVGDGWQ